MKVIITLLIFICLFHGAVVAQKETPKATMKKKEERTAAKKSAAKNEVAPQKKKATKLLAEKKKEVAAPMHRKEEMASGPADSEVMSKENITVVDDNSSKGPHENKDTVVAPAKPVFTPAPVAEQMSIWQEWVPWLSLVLIFIVGIYVFLTNANIHARLGWIQKNLDTQKNDFNWEKKKSQVSSAEIENLISANTALSKIQEEFNILKSNIEKLQQSVPVAIPVTPIAEPPDGTFYMTGPTNNYFPSSARSEHRENTVYRFILQPGGNEAMFEVHTTGASIREIIKVIESYIKPACDEENLPSSGTQNIVTRTPGRAILENEKWIIKDKAVIRYE